MTTHNVFVEVARREPQNKTIIRWTCRTCQEHGPWLDFGRGQTVGDQASSLEEAARTAGHGDGDFVR
jgi:hypothetical protein